MSFAKGLENYEPVEERLARFWAAYPKGRVLTEIVLGVADDKEIVIRADVYTDREDLRPAATGFAQETKGSTPVNRTSWLENCETSAIGRALANLGFAPKGSRPSREEMDKSQRPAKAPSKAAEAPAQTKASMNAKAPAKASNADILAVARKAVYNAILPADSAPNVLNEDCRAKAKSCIAWLEGKAGDDAAKVLSDYAGNGAAMWSDYQEALKVANVA